VTVTVKLKGDVNGWYGDDVRKRGVMEVKKEVFPSSSFFAELRN